MQFSQQVVNQAKKTRGYLEKKSSGLISVWQKRYFIILNQNLSYFADQTLTDEKKSISIQDINTIKVVDETQFHLVTKKRVYQLRTEQETDRDLWVASLNILLTHPHYSPTKSQSSLQRHAVLDLTSPKPKKTVSNSPSKTSLKNVSSDTSFSPSTFFACIGLQKVALNWKNSWLQERLFFIKMSRSLVFIFSSKRLTDSLKEEPFIKGDEGLVDENLVYPFELYIVYVYEFQNQEKGAVQVGKCSEITSIGDQGKRIVLMFGQKEFKIEMSSRQDINEKKVVLNKLQRLVKIGKQYVIPDSISLKKNIDKMLYLYDSKVLNFQQTVKKQINKCISECRELNPKIQFRKIIQNLYRSAKNIICNCDHLPQAKISFKEKLIRQFCSSSVNYINKHWSVVSKTLSISQSKKIILVLNNFEKVVSETAKDSRIIQLALNMHKQLMRKYEKELISKIESCFSLSEEEIIDQFEISLQGQSEIINEVNTHFLSNTIYRQLHIDIRLVLYQFQQMPVNEKILNQYLSLFRKLFKRIADLTFISIQKWKNLDVIIGTCNEIQFIKNSLFEQIHEKMTRNYQSMRTLIQNKCIKQIQTQISNTQILLVKNLFVITFSTIDRSILAKGFDQININVICHQILIKLSGFSKINKYVRRNIYEASFQEICYFYYTNIIKFNRNLSNKMNSSEFFANKIAEDVKSIEANFRKHINQSKIDAHLRDLLLLRQFIFCDVSQLRKNCQAIKKQFGNSFNQQAVCNLLALRDMTSEARQNLLQQFNEIVKNSADSLDEISMASSCRESFLDNWNNSRSRKSTLTLSINQFYENQHTIHQNKYSCSVWKQGYLYQKKMLKNGQSGAQIKAFYKINQSRIEKYETDNSCSPDQQYQLHKVKSCILHPEKNWIFFLEFKELKLQLKAESSDEAREWVRNIYQEIGTLNTLKQIPKDISPQSFEINKEVREFYDPSTMESYKAKERSLQKSIGSPIFKRKKETSEKEPTSPERVIWVNQNSSNGTKKEKKKEKNTEDSWYKCSKGCLF